jgi:DNA polymerase-3 subunit chi
MPKVDFYVLQQSGEPARQRFACRLAEKAWRLNNTVHIRTGDRQQAEHMDQLLWTFRDGSFVPHEIVQHNADNDAPITIGFEVEVAGEHDLMINLSPEVPSDVRSFPRIAEIVSSDDASRRLSRQHYADYREQGHTLDTHKL